MKATDRRGPPIVPPTILAAFLGFLAMAAAAGPVRGESLPPNQRDRQDGIPTSVLGTYAQRHEVLIYPSYEHATDHNQEYNPANLGFGPDESFRGKYRSSSTGIFLTYGLTRKVALEFETQYQKASLEKSPSDTSATPARIEESGIADIEGQVRIRLFDERRKRPEIYTFVEITAPVQTNALLIGSPDWDARPGLGLIHGYSWGTMTIWSTLEYNRELSAVNEPAHMDIGETAIEYLRRFAQSWLFSLAWEGGEGGAPDEWEFRQGLQGPLVPAVHLKVLNSVGVSSKAPDWTLQAGLLFILK